jgi:prepilin-type N-terminal cleavage/methylation domain-containing protein
MFTFNRRGHITGQKGFTLIELLVVIAIIGILSSVVLASLNSARKKGRDARRISDIKQIQLALELAYDADGSYPAVLSTTTIVTPGYIAALPTDPSDQGAYAYTPYTVSSGGTICSGYHLGTSLETAGHTSLNSDADVASVPTGYYVCSGASPTTDFVGTDAASTPCVTGDAGVVCFDVKS